MSDVLNFAGRGLALLSGPGLCIVLCVGALVAGAVAVYVVKQVAATRPTVEWRSKDGGGKVEFPAPIVRD